MFVVVLPLIAFAGCKSEAKPEVSTQTSASPPERAPAQEITLAVKSLAELQAWVAEQKGKVVVVDYWSTSCGPCVTELPHFAALQQKYGDKIACASFSLDYIGSSGGPSEKLQSQVLGVLKRLNVATTNFLSSDKDEAVTAELAVAAIPATMVYDRAGNLHKKFTNDEGEFGKEGYTYRKDIYPRVEELVGSEP
jgi:thiol-disulfide isomerase/thioredoxin